MIHETAQIHPSAVIEEGVKIGANVTVGPFTYIGKDVEIGDDNEIMSHVVIKGPTKIGNENRIFPYAIVGEECQDKKYNGEPTRLEIGDRNVIRESVQIHRGTVQDKGVTIVGNDNLLCVNAHIAHDVVVGNHTHIGNNSILGGHVYCCRSCRCDGAICDPSILHRRRIQLCWRLFGSGTRRAAVCVGAG